MYVVEVTERPLSPEGIETASVALCPLTEITEQSNRLGVGRKPHARYLSNHGLVETGLLDDSGYVPVRKCPQCQHSLCGRRPPAEVATQAGAMGRVGIFGADLG
jgi:hypothetical protein